MDFIGTSVVSVHLDLNNSITFIGARVYINIHTNPLLGDFG